MGYFRTWVSITPACKAEMLAYLYRWVQLKLFCTNQHAPRGSYALPDPAGLARSVSPTVPLHSSLQPSQLPAAYVALHPCLQTSYHPFALSPTPICLFPNLLTCRLFFHIPASFFFPELLSGLQWNAGGLRARSVKLFHFFHSLQSILFVSRNPTSTHLHLSGFLDTLIYNLIAFTSNQVLLQLILSALAVILSLLSDGRFISKFSTSYLSFHLPPTVFDYAGFNISLKTFLLSLKCLRTS